MNTKKNLSTFQSINYGFVIVLFCIYGFLIFMPFYRKALPYFIAILIITLFFFPKFTVKWQRLKKKIGTLILFTSYYLIYSISFFYTENKEAGITDLILKSLLFIFPIIICCTALYFKRHHLNNFLIIFICSAFASSLTLLIRSLILFLQTDELSVFLYDKFSVFLHPGYFAMYINFALGIVLYFLEFKKDGFGTFKKAFLILLAAYFIIIILLLNSKAVFLSTSIVIIIWIFYIIFIKKQFLRGIIFSASILLILTLSLKLSPQIYTRVVLAIENVHPERKKINRFDGTYMRIQIWQSSAEIIKNNFWTGVGVGDVKDVLIEEYRKNGFDLIVERELNAHNQFIQSFAASGILGFISLVFIVLMPLIYNRKSPFVFLALIFTVIIATGFSFESVLETQAGVAFFSFFSTFFIFLTPQTKDK